MRRSLSLLAVVVLLFVPLSAHAVEKGQFEISLGGGAGVPLSDFSDVAEVGFLVGGNFGYYVSPQFALGVEGNYHQFKASDELIAVTELFLFLFTGVPVDVDIDWTVFQMVAYGKYLFMANNVAPYGKLAAGYYSLGAKISALGESESDSESNFGVGAGLGLQFQGGGQVGGFLEALIHNILASDEDAQYIEIKAGINIFVGQGATGP